MLLFIFQQLLFQRLYTILELLSSFNEFFVVVCDTVRRISLLQNPSSIKSDNSPLKLLKVVLCIFAQSLVQILFKLANYGILLLNCLVHARSCPC